MPAKRTWSIPPIGTFLFFVMLGLGALIFGLCMIARRPFADGRFTVVVLGEPVEVISYDQDRNSWAIVQMTKDAHISGVFGLGEYRLDALWQLGKTEASPSAILRESLAEELGVHIPYYIVPKPTAFTPWSGPLSLAVSTVTVSHMGDFLRGQYDSNLLFPDYLKLWWRLRSMEPQKVERYIIREGSGLVKQTGPDGAAMLRFDRQAFDIRTSYSFEELAVRKEAKRVVVYNTTNTPAIGSRVGRMIDKLGANLVAVGNDTNSLVQGCVLSGSQEALNSITAQRIISLFGCELGGEDDDKQGDLTVRVGKIFAERFINN